MPFVLTILLTLATLGLVFLFVLVACAFEGFATLRAWFKLSRSIRELNAIYLSTIAFAKQETERARQGERDCVASLDKLPTWQCDRDDCPRNTCGR